MPMAPLDSAATNIDQNRRIYRAFVTLASGVAQSPQGSRTQIILRKRLDHPDLSEFVRGSDTGGTTFERSEHEDRLFVPGQIDPDRSSEIEEAVWNTIPFASSMRAHRLGELTIGSEIHRSESLAIVQVLILYHLLRSSS